MMRLGLFVFYEIRIVVYMYFIICIIYMYLIEVYIIFDFGDNLRFFYLKFLSIRKILIFY